MNVNKSETEHNTNCLRGLRGKKIAAKQLKDRTDNVLKCQ